MSEVETGAIAAIRRPALSRLVLAPHCQTDGIFRRKDRSRPHAHTKKQTTLRTRHHHRIDQAPVECLSRFFLGSLHGPAVSHPNRRNLALNTSLWRSVSLPLGCEPCSVFLESPRRTCCYLWTTCSLFVCMRHVSLLCFCLRPPPVTVYLPPCALFTVCCSVHPFSCCVGF